MMGMDRQAESEEPFRQLAEAIAALRERNEELRAANARAEAANAAKDRFLATLSHELRTPLTPVLALTSALEKDDRLPMDVRDALGTVRRNVELEARLIDDLLDLTRIARGKLELRREVADLAEILDQALLTCCTAEVISGRLAVTTELAAGDHRLWADAPRLTQVLWNLLNNAVKFTPEGGRIAVRTWAEEGAEGRRLVLQVEDSGIGIEPEVLPRIFDGFEQGQRAITRRFGGLGLGLAVSKAIAEMHGGELSAASPGRDQGATFTLRLPVGALPVSTAEREAADALEPPAGERSLHILLVEDHADTAAALAELLGSIGHRVSLAGSVGEGLAVAQGGRLDLVVSDLGLPDGSGLDLMRELSRRHGLKGIALSGYGMEEDVESSHAAGFSLHLTKPIKFQDLVAAIGRVGT
jgi:signal transduction histidine kinase/CheY-like chemotaxis protein